MALDAVRHLIGAVRDTAALLTTLHSEAAVEHQCVLLGRMLVSRSGVDASVLLGVLPG